MSDPWRAPAAERADPGLVLDERAALEAWLDYHRATLLSKCAGLTGEQLAQQSVPPSTLSLLGLVRHMTDVERGWLRMHAGEQDLPWRYWSEGQDPDIDFNGVDPERAEAELDAYREEIEAARATVATRGLDDVVPSRGHHPERVRNVRWLYLHMIEEYARHNGHADLLRERIDGVTGD